MPTELVRRIDLDLLYRPFLEQLLEALAAARARGADYYAISGFRTYEEQDAEFAKGRTVPGLIVTGARGGQSAHCFGLAVDLCRDALPGPEHPGLQPAWKREDYAILGEEVRRVGLAWGGDWHRQDLPHVQWPGYITSKDMEPLRLALAAGWLPAVFEYLDARHGL